MTVGELKEKLYGIPDDAQVVAPDKSEVRITYSVSDGLKWFREREDIEAFPAIQAIMIGGKGNDGR